MRTRTRLIITIGVTMLVVMIAVGPAMGRPFIPLNADVPRDSAPTPTIVTVSESDGFNWGDAGIGIAVALMTVAVIGASVDIRRRKSSPAHT